MGSTAGEVFRIGVDVLNTSVSEKTKAIVAQTGSVKGEATYEDNVEWWQHVGFASRPSKVEAKKTAAQAVVVKQGGYSAAIASQDLRGLKLYGQLAPGETCLYAAGEDGTAQGRILIKADGSINIFTTEGNESGGAGMGVFVRADGSIDLVSHSGAGVMLGTDGSIKVFNGSGSVQVTASGGIKLASSGAVEISGGSVTLGGTAALPVAIGPNVVTAITAIENQIMALQTGLAACAAASVAAFNIAGPIIPATHGAAAAAATTAVGVSAGMLAAQAVPLASAMAIIPALQTSAQ